MKTDTSNDYYRFFYNSGDRLLRLTLKDGKVLEGRFIGFFHGEEERNEPYIVKWHFLQKGTEPPLKSSIFPTQQEGIYIDHDNIESVEFCT